MFNFNNLVKQTLGIPSFCLAVSASFAQIPNGNFEEWLTVDSIENPVHWETNNNYVGFTPVAKTLDAIQGNYSLKVSSTARDVGGYASGDGCAHVKLAPTEVYKFLTASVKIDTVDTNGEVIIRVKQWLPTNGIFEKIGTWKVTTATNGVVQVVLPIEQLSLDTLLIEIWAKNNYDLLSNPGYTEIIIDNLKLKMTVAVEEPSNNPFGVIFPNPTTEILNIHLYQPFQKSSTLRVVDAQGRILQSHNFPTLSATTLNLADIPPGHYFLELKGQNQMTRIEKFVVIR